jgi:hypothetical protein
MEGRRGQPSGWARSLNGSLTAARARRYCGSGPPLIRVVLPAGAPRWRRLCRRHEPGLPAHLSQQVGRTETPGHGTVIPTAQPAYLHESAIPRGFPRRRNPFSQRKRAGLEPRVPPGRSDGVRIWEVARAGISWVGRAKSLMNKVSPHPRSSLREPISPLVAPEARRAVRGLLA